MLSANSAVHRVAVPSGRRTPSAVRPVRPGLESVAVVRREFAVRESVAGERDTREEHESEINYHQLLRAGRRMWVWVYVGVRVRVRCLGLRRV